MVSSPGATGVVRSRQSRAADRAVAFAAASAASGAAADDRAVSYLDAETMSRFTSSLMRRSSAGSLKLGDGRTVVASRPGSLRAEEVATAAAAAAATTASASNRGRRRSQVAEPEVGAGTGMLWQTGGHWARRHF